MLKRHVIFRCAICGNITEVLQAGGGTLSCCGQPMDFLGELSADSTVEKHVPHVHQDGNLVLVKVGEAQEHPMLDAHYILWIEILTNQGVHRKFLKPGDKPEASFQLSAEEMVLGAREYCNLHGLWKG